MGPCLQTYKNSLLISKKVPVEYVPAGSGFNFIRGAYTKAQIPLGNKIIPRNLYEQIIKPKILDVSDDYAAYRTYKLGKVGVAYVLNYKLNIHLESIREALRAQMEGIAEEVTKAAKEDLDKQHQKFLAKQKKDLETMLKKSARKLPKMTMKKLMSAAAMKKMTKPGMHKKIDVKFQKKSTKPIKLKTKKPTASKPKKRVRKVKTVKRKTTKKK